MDKTIQRPLVCQIAHCGAMCCFLQAEEMYRIWDGEPNKCPYYERRDDLYRNTKILDKIKQVRKQIASKRDDPAMSWKEKDYGRNEMIDEILENLDKLIAESED